MARAAKTTKKDIESLKHREARRKHIPTTELESLVSDEERAPKVIRYKRNTDLDPQLVWRGKDEQDAEDLTVDAVPIYIQEKIKPEQIISDLKRRSEAIRRERAENEQYAIPDLYSDFNGLAEPGSEFAFYKHDKNWSSRMILGASLLVMTSLAEKEALTGKFKCIYMDPPYGIRFKSNWQPSTKSPNVAEGQVGLTREPEMIRAFRDTWKDGVHSYLAYLRDRLSITHRLLDTDGSLFVQIGDENLHLVRALLDEIFGRENFKAIISYKRLGMMMGEELQTSTHFIIWFTKKVDETTPRKLFIDQVAGVGTGDHYSQVEQPDGKVRPLSKEEKTSGRLDPVGSRAFQLTTDGRSPGWRLASMCAAAPSDFGSITEPAPRSVDFRTLCSRRSSPKSTANRKIVYAKHRSRRGQRRGIRGPWRRASCRSQRRRARDRCRGRASGR
jgi:adenine-specific DNA-methyltransferase